MDARESNDFEILATGDWGPGEVEAAFDENAVRPADPRVEAEIARVWEIARAEADRSGALLFPGSLCRLVSFGAEEGRLRLRFGPTNYRDYVGTNLNLAALREIVLDPEPVLANPAGVCAAVVTADDLIAVGRRSALTMTDRGAWHVPAGHADESHIDGCRVDVFAAMRDEIAEDLAVTQAAVSSLRCLGLARQTEWHKPELLFTARVPLTSDEFRSRLIGPEHDELAFVRDNPAELAAYLIDHAAVLVPPAKACLALHGRRTHGEAWFAGLLPALS